MAEVGFNQQWFNFRFRVLNLLVRLSILVRKLKGGDEYNQIWHFFIGQSFVQHLFDTYYMPDPDPDPGTGRRIQTDKRKLIVFTALKIQLKKTQ